MNFKNYTKSIYIFCFVLIISIASANAKLQSLDDEELGDINAQAGVSIGIKDVSIFQFYDNFHYEASDEGSISLKNIKIHDGLGGAARYDGIIHIDTGEFEVASQTTPGATETKNMVSIQSPSWTQQKHYTIGNLEFCGKDLGSIDIGNIDTPSFATYIAPHQGAGVDFEYGFELHIDSFKYNYSNSNFLEFKGIHFGESFTKNNPIDNATDPTTWDTANIGHFKIGDMFGDISSGKLANPATFDVGVISTSEGNLASVVMNLPMQGSIRVEDVNMGGRSFGPIAIDGMQMHRFEVQVSP